MPVYAKNLTKNQREALQKYESICGFEPMHQDDFDSGKISFKSLWYENIYWLECVLAEVSNINTGKAFDDEDKLLKKEQTQSDK